MHGSLRPYGELAESTKRQLARHARQDWEPSDIALDMVELVSTPQPIYRAYFDIRQGELMCAVTRVRVNRANHEVYNAPVTAVQSLPKRSALYRRLVPLFEHYPMERLAEICHAAHGRHSDFCNARCVYPTNYGN